MVLFTPLSKENYNLVNNILYVTRKKFHMIGIMFAGMGLVVAVIYTLFINSDLNRRLIFSVIIMAVIPSAFNLFYATTYRVLIQTMQRLERNCFLTMQKRQGQRWLFIVSQT